MFNFVCICCLSCICLFWVLTVRIVDVLFLVCLTLYIKYVVWVVFVLSCVWVCFVVVHGKNHVSSLKQICSANPPPLKSAVLLSKSTFQNQHAAIKWSLNRITNCFSVVVEKHLGRAFASTSINLQCQDSCHTNPSTAENSRAALSESTTGTKLHKLIRDRSTMNSELKHEGNYQFWTALHEFREEGFTTTVSKQRFNTNSIRWLVSEKSFDHELQADDCTTREMIAILFPVRSNAWLSSQCIQSNVASLIASHSNAPWVHSAGTVCGPHIQWHPQRI